MKLTLASDAAPGKANRRSGAISIPIDELEERLGELPKSKEAVAEGLPVEAGTSEAIP